MKEKRDEKYSREYADRCMDQIIKKMRSQDYSEAVQDSRIMLQMLIKDLSEKSGLEYIEGNLKESFENLKVELDLIPTKGEGEESKKIIEGLSMVIWGIDGMKDENKSHLTKGEAKLYLSSSLIISEFLLERYLQGERNRVWS